MKKIIEVNLGVGLNQFFPEPVKILIEEEKKKKSKTKSEKSEDTNKPDKSK